jgi:hypothetical protein
MTFIEIAGGSEGHVFIPLTAVGRIQGRPAGQSGSTVWLLDGITSYRVTEDAHQVRIKMVESQVGLPTRLTLEVAPEPLPMIAVIP